MAVRFRPDQADDSTQPSIPVDRTFRQVLWQRKFLFLLGSLAGPGLAVLYFLTSTPVYQANAQVLVVKKRLDPTAGPDVRQGPVEDYVSTQRELMKSPLVVERVVRKLDPATLSLSPEERDNPTDAILKRLTVTRAKDPAGGPSNVVTLSYRGGGIDECNAVLTSVIDSYRAFLDESYIRVSEDSLTLLTRSSDGLKAELAKKEAAYLVFLQQLPPAGRAKERNNARQERLASIESKRTAFLVRLTEVEGQLAALQKAMKEGRSREGLQAMVDSASARLESDGPRTNQAQVLRDHLLPLLLQEQKLLEKYGPEHPEVVGIRKQIATAQTAVIRSLTAAGSGEGSGPDRQPTLPDPVQGWLEYLKQERDRLQTSERLLAGLGERELDEATKQGAAEFQDEVFRNDIARTRQLCEIDNSRLEDARRSREFGGYDAQVIAPPGSGGVKRIAPALIPLLAAAMVLSLLGGGGLVLLAEGLDRGFRTPEEISQRLGLPVLGQIPFLPRRLRSRPASTRQPSSLAPALYAHHSPTSSEAEANRGVYTTLSLVNRNRGPRVIQFTSPSTGDGTTTVAANLAVAAARSGKRVILVDVNFLRPGLRPLFGLPDGAGLSSILMGEAMPDDVIRESDVKGLSLLPSGPSGQNPSELLESNRFHELIEYLRQRYDLVLLDTPALLAGADSRAVASRVDGVVLTLRVPGGTRPHAERARELLRTVVAPMIGVVVNQTRRRGSYTGHRYDSHHVATPGYNQGIEHAAETKTEGAGALHTGNGKKLLT